MVVGACKVIAIYCGMALWYLQKKPHATLYKTAPIIMILLMN